MKPKSVADYSFLVNKKSLTAKVGWSIALAPGNELSCKIVTGLTGNDDVLLTAGMNNLVKDNDLKTEGFSFCPPENSGACTLCFSLSVAELRDLKLSLGRRFFMDDLPLDNDGLGGINILAEVGVIVLHESTFVEAELGVGGIFILTDVSPKSLDGISIESLGLFQL